MKFIVKVILFTVVNAIAILLSAHFITGFIFDGNLANLAIVALILTLCNIFIRPVLKFILAPLITLTFGILAIIINVLILHYIDKFSPSITINGLTPLILATIVISIVNILVNLSTNLGD